MTLDTVELSDRRGGHPVVGRGARGALIASVAVGCLAGTASFGPAADPTWLLDAANAFGLGDHVTAALTTSSHASFHRLVFWASVVTTGYLVVPLIAVKVALREPIADFGLRASGFLEHSAPYLVILGVAVPFVVAASFGDAFQSRYPFYTPVHGDGLWPWTVAWWAVYAVQFVGVEFLFRGFLVLGLAPVIGWRAVPLSTVPYVLIHLDKPVPEMIGAGFTGLALGALVLRSRSIWWGVAVHVAAALLLDVLALAHKGLL